MTLVNCTIAGNTAIEASGGLVNGGILSTAELHNCIFWGNSLGGATDESAQLINAGDNVLTVDYSAVQGWTGDLGGVGNIGDDPGFADPAQGDYRLSPGSPGIDAADNSALDPGGCGDCEEPDPDGLPGCSDSACAALVCEVIPYCCSHEWADFCADWATSLCDCEQLDLTTDLDGNPRFLEIPETPDTGNGDPPIVDMGAYESFGAGCLAITSQEVICHGDGSTFTVNVEGLNACTGGSTMVTFTGAGGAVGEDFCATLIVNTEAGGYCCTTQLCVPVPDCSGSALPGDLDGDGVVGVLDLLALLGAWGPNLGHPADCDGDGAVGVTDVLILLENWGPCP
jgi:hypothetical protein